MNALKAIVRVLADRAARSYVAGPHLSDAIDYASALERDGMSSTVAYWNAVGDHPADVCTAYLSAIDAIAAAGLRSYVSIKAPALSMSARHVDALAAHCRERRIALHFDSLTVEHQAGTLDQIERLVPTGIGLGCTLPARFGRSPDDAERAVAQRWRVRVVKGQWADPACAVDARTGFMALIDQLAGRAAHVAVATHDPRLAEDAMTRLRSSGTPAELELLLGLPASRVVAVARRLQVPVRVYVPYGHAWLPYALSALRAHPRMLLWLLDDALRGQPAVGYRRS